MQKFVLSMLMMLVVASPSWALLRSDVRVVEGAVTSKDVQTKVMTVKVDGSQELRQFAADDAQLSMVQDGNQVMIMHDDGSNQINFLRVLR